MKIDNPNFINTIELGHATDTTISRVSAGVISVEGATVITTAPSTSGNVLTSNGTIWTSAAPAGGLTTVEVSLTSSNIMNMFATPVTVIAGTAGKVIDIISVTLSFTAGTQYTGGGNVRLVEETSGVVIFGTVMMTAVDINSAASSIKSSAPLAGSAARVTGKAAQITNQTGAFVTGTGTLKLYITYQLVTPT